MAALFPHLQPAPLATPPTDMNAGNPNVALSDANPDRWVLPANSGPVGNLADDGRGASGTVGSGITQEEASPPGISTNNTFQPTDTLTGTVSRQRATWEQRHPEFEYPNPVPAEGALSQLQSQQNALAKAKYQREHLENEDHGVKGFAKEILANFLEGLSHAKPGMGLLSSLALGGVGAGAGAINRTWNEQRGLDKLIPGLEKDVETETANALKNEQISTIRRDDQRQTANTQNEITTRNAKTLIDIAEEGRKQTESEAKAGNWEPRIENGLTFKHFPDGHEEPLMRDGKQVADLIKTPVKTIVDGQEVWTLGEKVLENATAKEYRQAQMDFDASKYNTEEINDYSERLEKWATEESKRKQQSLQDENDANTKLAEADTLDAQAKDADARAAELKADNYDNSAVIKEANDARSKAVVARKEGESLKNKAANSVSLPKPTKPKASLSAPNLSGHYRGQIFPSPSAIKSAFPGKSEKEIRAIVEGQGGKFQQ